MAYKNKDDRKLVRSGKSGRHAVVAGKSSGGKEVWQIHTRNGVKRVVTSARSAKVMDEAMTTYDSTLRQLADQ